MSTPASNTAQRLALGLCFGAMGALMLGFVLFDLLVPNGNVSNSSTGASSTTDSKAPADTRDVTELTEAGAQSQSSRRQSLQTTEPRAEPRAARNVVTIPSSRGVLMDNAAADSELSELSGPKFTPSAAKTIDSDFRARGLNRAIVNNPGWRAKTLRPNIATIASQKDEAQTASD